MMEPSSVTVAKEMDLNCEDSISKQKGIQIQGSWIPATPVKPILEKTQLSHKNREITDDFSTGLCQENKPCQVVDGSEDKEGRSRQVPIVYKARRNNKSFVDLLDQASTGSTVSSASCNMAQGDPYDCCFNHRIENSWSKSLRITKDLSLGVKLHTNNTRQCELPNVLPNIIADELSSRTTPQFSPITRDKRIHNENLTEKEKIPSHTDDSSLPVVSTSVTENPSPEQGSSEAIDPSKKQNRKKHRPKVIIEGKAKRERKSPLLKSDASKENAARKRKYVRKKVTDEIAMENTDPKSVDATKKSARKPLKANLNGHEINESYVCKSGDVSPEAQEQQSSGSKIQSETETSVQTGQQDDQLRIIYDLVCSANRYLQYYICQEPNTQPPLNSNLPPKKRKANTQMETADEKTGSEPINMEKGNKLVSSPNNSAAEKKSECTHILDANHPITMNPVGTWYKGLQEYHETFQVQDYDNINFGMHFPDIYKKRRTEKGEASTPSSTSTSSTMTTTKNDVQLVQECMQNHTNASFSESKSNTWISSPRLQNQRRRSLRHKERLTKAISNVHARLHNFASFKENADSQVLVNFPSKRASNRPQNCIQALVEDKRAKLAKGKRSKIQKSLTSSIVSSRDAIQMRQRNVLYIHHKILTKPDPPPVVVWKHVTTVDAITERFGHLNINLETNLLSCQTYYALVPYNTRYQSHNAPDPYQLGTRLIIHRRDGNIVPFDGTFYNTKRRRPRAKVDLDEETSRVWKLLLENINNEGINGTDEQNEKWWEDERKVFCGRADSFIARMHLVQGDRRFSKWKGSIVDSVVGVFLTQNVSDHLSSSAFMSLAAHFPLKANCNEQQSCAEGTSIMVDEPVSDQSSVTLNEFEQNEETEAANNNESLESNVCCLNLNYDMDNFHESSTQQIDIETCQSSVDSSIAQTDEKRLEQFSEAQYPETSPKPSSFNGSAFVQNVVYVDVARTLNQNHNHESCPEQSDKSSVDASGDHNSTLTPASILQEVGCIECCEEINIYKKKDKKSTTKSFSTPTFRTKLTAGVHELGNITHEEEQPRDMPAAKEAKKVESLVQNEVQQNKSPNILGEASDVTESSSVFNTEPKETEPNLKEHNQSSNKTFNQKRMDGLGTKSKGVGNEKNWNVNWDSLRKQAQVNGVRERTASTEDSLDWEAVRCADVGEIAETIKARGMNNILAARIKGFLNRVVSQHGSLDLEWLRDVHPDKAKEYLLSIRGLGLKSVECVRLLTLHHLAFPVDTNVGRIAVRLGWVPLQPLPESLQLHLLELYPVLESIQKYLWPRLCKLDQKTLYELHYQMITFGKVFCTKSKPNCNACPMRAECRHFASAFASARLALPGPEEKSIVSASEKREADHTPDVITNRLQLPSPHVDQKTLEIESEAKSGTGNNEPIIEQPATPELDIEESLEIPELDIEDQFYEDPDEIPTIKLNIEEFTQNLQHYMKKNMELQDSEMSRALVAISEEAASIPTPKLKYISRLRTEHQVYELPHSHPLLQGLDKRERDDPCPYLLAIWTAGETVSSIQPPSGSSSHEVGKLCSEPSCFSCNSIREANSQTVRGTLLIPCRTAMRGSFPLNGTYFQVNEVFADHESSLRPIDVPRAWIWDLPRRTVFFGTSIPTIFKGLTTEDIQYCFWKGFVCVRGFDRKERAPRPLIARLHFPASKSRGAKTNEE